VKELYYLDQAFKEAGNHSVGYIPCEDRAGALRGSHATNQKRSYEAAYELVQNWPNLPDGGQVLTIVVPGLANVSTGVLPVC